MKVKSDDDGFLTIDISAISYNVIPCKMRWVSKHFFMKMPKFSRMKLKKFTNKATVPIKYRKQRANNDTRGNCSPDGPDEGELAGTKSEKLGPSGRSGWVGYTQDHPNA